MRAIEFSVVRYSRCERMEFHAHADSSLSVVLDGEVQESRGEDWQRVGPLGLLAKPAGVRHADRFGPAETRILRVRFGESPDWLDRYVCGAGPAASLVAARLARAWHTGEPAALESALEATAQLCRGDDPPPRSDPDREAADAVLAALENGDPVAEIAEHHALHPVHFARWFRRRFGLAPRDYRTQHRAAHAVALLRDGETDLAQVAQRAGFSDQAHLTRILRRLTGTTPGVLRSALRRARTRGSEPPSENRGSAAPPPAPSP